MASQQTLRLRTGVFALILVVIHFFVLMYVSSAASKLNLMVFQREMLYRVTYVAAIAEMVSFSTLTTDSVLSSLSDKTAFTISMRSALPDGEEPVKNLALSSGYPAIASKYSPVLDAVISVEEGEVTDASNGCSEEFIAIGVCFLVLIPMTLFAVLSAGNLLASRGRPRLACGLAWIGFVLLPAAISVGLMLMLIFVQKTSSLNAWEEDMRRTATLYSETFLTICSVKTTTTAEMLATTMKYVNDNVVDGDAYQVVVSVGADRVVMPELHSNGVYEQAFGSAKTKKIVTSGIVDGYVWASSSLPTVTSLLLTARQLQKSPNLFDTEFLIPFLLVLLFTVLSGVGFMWWGFPMRVLGTIALPPEGASPWANRLSRHWPEWKLFEIGVLMTVALIVFSMSLARLTTHFRRTSALQDYYLAKVVYLQKLQKVSDMFGQCYTDILEGKGWNSVFMDYLSKNLTEDQHIYLYQFFHELTTTVKTQKYFIYSCGDDMSQEPQNLWPLLTNMPSIVKFLAGNVKSDAATITFMSLLLRFDNAMMVAVLSNNKDFLAKGDADLQQSLESAFADLTNSGLTLADIQEAISMTLLSAAPYLAIVEAYEKQGIDVTTYVELYQSDLGLQAVKMVQDATTEEMAQIPANKYINLTYPWGKFNSMYVCVAFFLMTFVLSIFDTLYSAMFFAHLKLKWLRRRDDAYREPDRVTIHSNDYSSPSSQLVINMHGVRHGVQLILLYTCGFIVVTLLVATIFISRAALNVNLLRVEVEYLQGSLVPICERAGGLAVVEMSLSTWSQAYLSLQKEHINSAIDMSMRWTNFRPISWVGGKAEHDPARFSSTLIRNLLTNLMKVSVQTSLLRSEPSLEGLYKDEIYLLNEFDNYFHFSGYQTCLQTAVYQWERYAGIWLVCVLNPSDACLESVYPPLQAFARMCQGRGLPDDFNRYIRRVPTLQMRSFTMYNHNEMADLMTSLTPKINSEVDQVIVLLSQKFANMKTEMSMGLPWVGVLYGWLAAPFVFLLYKSARGFHMSLYYT